MAICSRARYLGSRRGISVCMTISGILVGGFALAHGPKETIFDAPIAYAPLAEPLAPSDMNPEKLRASSRHSRHARAKPVCVRLCDGYFFPSYTAVGGDAVCAAQCPDAPVAMYSMAGDDIDEAVSTAGTKYSELAFANRYSAKTDSECVCHRHSYGGSYAEILKDPTLRKGDLVMTTSGFVEYTGGSAANAFVAVERAPGISEETRQSLRSAKALVANEQ